MPPVVPSAAGRRGGMRGVALAQLVVALALIGLVGAVAVGWRAAGARCSSQDRARALVGAYAQAVLEWQERHPGRSCPQTLGELRPVGFARAPLLASAADGLRPAATSAGGYGNPVRVPMPIDPWGAPLVYRCPGSEGPAGFDLLSMGPDGREGTADDIQGWE